MKRAIFLLLVALLLAGCDVAASTPTVTVPTPAASLNSKLAFGDSPKVTPGNSPSVDTTVANLDIATHSMDILAYFYSKPLSEMGDAKADFMVAMGSAYVVLKPGERATIHIDGEAINPGTAVSVDFDAIEK